MEVDIYQAPHQFDHGPEFDRILQENNLLQKQIASLERESKTMRNIISDIKRNQENLTFSIYNLSKTVKASNARKDQIIVNLRQRSKDVRLTKSDCESGVHSEESHNDKIRRTEVDKHNYPRALPRSRSKSPRRRSKSRERRSRSRERRSRSVEKYNRRSVNEMVLEDGEIHDHGTPITGSVEGYRIPKKKDCTESSTDYRKRHATVMHESSEMRRKYGERPYYNQWLRPDRYRYYANSASRYRNTAPEREPDRQSVKDVQKVPYRLVEIATDTDNTKSNSTTEETKNKDSNKTPKSSKYGTTVDKEWGQENIKLIVKDSCKQDTNLDGKADKIAKDDKAEKTKTQLTNVTKIDRDKANVGENCDQQTKDIKEDGERNKAKEKVKLTVTDYRRKKADHNKQDELKKNCLREDERDKITPDKPKEIVIEESEKPNSNDCVKDQELNKKLQENVIDLEQMKETTRNYLFGQDSDDDSLPDKTPKPAKGRRKNRGIEDDDSDHDASSDDDYFPELKEDERDKIAPDKTKETVIEESEKPNSNDCVKEQGLDKKLQQNAISHEQMIETTRNYLFGKDSDDDSLPEETPKLIKGRRKSRIIEDDSDDDYSPERKRRNLGLKKSTKINRVANRVKLKTPSTDDKHTDTIDSADVNQQTSDKSRTENDEMPTKRVLRSDTKKLVDKVEPAKKIADVAVSPSKDTRKCQIINEYITAEMSHDGAIPVIHISESETTTNTILESSITPNTNSAADNSNSTRCVTTSTPYLGTSKDPRDIVKSDLSLSFDSSGNENIEQRVWVTSTGKRRKRRIVMTMITTTP